MDNDTRQKITDELTAFLNRPPSENEIMNAQTDINIMGKVKDKQNEKEIKKLKDDIIKLKK